MKDTFVPVKMINKSNDSEVLLVHDTDCTRHYYIKSIRKTDQIDLKKRFYWEMNIVASLDHPNIAKPIDAHFENDYLYMLYPYVEGKTLYQMLEESPRIKFKNAFYIIRQLLSALSYIHSRGIIHADINPNNIFVSTERGVSLLDFGMSLMDDDAEKLTDGQLVGTFPYLSPEQMGFTQFKIDTRTDLYCAAIILYQMLAGKLPFPMEENSLNDLLTASVKREVTGVRHVPQYMNEILLKALRPTPLDRYQTAEGMLFDISIAAEKMKNEDGTSFPVGRKDAILAVNRKSMFVVREKEIERLVSSLHQLNQGTAVSYLIYGKSGIGKTELIREFKRQVDPRQLLFLGAKCNRFTPSQPYSIFRQLVIEFLHTIRNIPPEKRKEVKRRIIQTLSGYSGLLCTIIPELRQWFKEVKDVDHIETEKETDRIIFILTQLLRTMCSVQQCVIYIDDFQWSDKITSEVVIGLLELNVSSFIICNYRTADDRDVLDLFGHDLKRVGFGRTIKLKAFSKKDTSEFIAKKFRSLDDGEKLTNALFEKSDGVPYVLAEAIRYLVNKGVMTSKDKLWQYNMSDLEKLPDKFDDVSLVLQKVEELTEDEKRFLRVASLVEGLFEYETLARIVNLRKYHQHRLLHRLESYGFIVSKLTGGYAFAHDRIQESIAYDIVPAEKHDIYEKLGTVYLENAETDREKIFNAAEYFLKSRHTGKAIDVSYQAALYALDKKAFDLAIKYLRNITLMASGTFGNKVKSCIDINQVFVSLGDVLMLTGANEEALHLFAQVVARKDLNKLEKLEIEYKIGSIYHNVGEFEKSTKYFIQSLHNVGIHIHQHKGLMIAALVKEMFVQALHRLGIHRLFRKKPDDIRFLIVRILNKLSFSVYFNDMLKCFYIHFKALNAADYLPDSAEKTETYTSHQIPAYQLGMKRRSVNYLEKSVEIANRLQQKDRIAFAKTFGGVVCYYNAQWKKAEALLHEGIIKYGSVGDVNGQVIGREHLWKIRIMKGEINKIISDMDQTITTCKKVKEIHYILVTKAAKNYCTYLISGKLDTEEYDYLCDALETAKTALFFVEVGGYLLKTEIEAGKLQKAFIRARQLFPLIRKKLINCEYQVSVYSQFSVLLVKEMLSRLKGKRNLDVSGSKLTALFAQNSIILLRSSLTFPAYRGTFYRNVAWFFGTIRFRKIAHFCFKKSIHLHHRLSMRFEEALSLKEYAEFIDEFCNEPGTAKDLNKKAMQLMQECGIKLYGDRMSSAIHENTIHGIYDVKEENEIPDDRMEEKNDSGVNAIRFKALVEVSKTITETSDPSILFRQILSAMITVTHAQYGYLSINRNAYAGYAPIAMSFEGKEVPVKEVPVFQDLVNKVNEIHTMQSTGETVLDDEEEMESSFIRSDLCVPLNWRDKYLGYVYLVNDQVRGLFGEGARKTALILAAHAGILLENVTLIRREKEFNEQLKQKVDEQTHAILEKNRQLVDTNLKLIESERMKGVLSGTLVHDIKNYAAGINGNLIALNRKIGDDPKLHKIINVVDETCSDIASLASNLLDIAKMDDGKLNVREELLDYHFFSAMSEKFGTSALFEEKKIVTRIIEPDDEFVVVGDRYLMERVMQNLYSNAAKYAPKGSNVEMRFFTSEEENILCFFNSGKPIPDADKEELFEKYARLKNKHSQYSKGLGLFFCRMVMHAQKGRIWLDTDERGNYFKLEFPRKEFFKTCAESPETLVYETLR